MNTKIAGIALICLGVIGGAITIVRGNVAGGIIGGLILVALGINVYRRKSDNV